MTNNDTLFGTFNKHTNIIEQVSDGSSAFHTFANVDEAKAYYFTDKALAVFDSRCTNLQWALVADDDGNNTKLKYTYDFGTRADKIDSPDNDNAGLFKSEMTAIQNEGGTYMPQWFAHGNVRVTNSTDHLF